MEVVIIANKSKHAKRNGFHGANWLGKRSRFSCSNPFTPHLQPPPNCHEAVRVYLAIWKIRAPDVLIFTLRDKKARHGGCVSFSGSECEKKGVHSWSASLLCGSQKTTDFARTIVETMNLTLHTQMEGVNWDNWQIPWRNEMPRTAESNSSVCFLSGRRNHRVLMYCLPPPPPPPHPTPTPPARPPHTEKHILFLSGEFRPNLVGSNGGVKIRKLVFIRDVLTFHSVVSIKKISWHKRLREICWNQKYYEDGVWNIYHVNEIYQSATQRHRRTNQPPPPPNPPPPLFLLC